ncbi:hypothetical protein DRQ11_10585 [candidate division KSB1 bacterium]|nr:MAG: hypothetical protein DRQ11_10585 [candidate division KSB1 bacterium]
MGSRSDWRIFVLIIVAGLAIRLLAAIITPEDYLSWEARENYLMRAQSLLDGKLPYRDFWESKPPLWTCLFAIWGKMFGVNVISLKMLIITSEMFFIALLYYFTKIPFHDSKLALISAGFYAFLPMVLFVSAVEGKYESLTFIFFLVALWLILANKTSLAGAVLGIGMGFKFNSALMMVPIILFLLKSDSQPGRKIMGFLFAIVFVLGIILTPFLIIAPDNFFRDAIQNFVIGQGHHPIPYKAISIWGALRQSFHLEAPQYLPHLFQFSLMAFLFWLLWRKHQQITKFSLVMYSYIFITAYLLFIRVGNIQYFCWSIPFLSLIVAYLFDKRRTIPEFRCYLTVLILQTFLVFYTWKNWYHPIGGSLMVILTLAVTGYCLYMVTKLAISESKLQKVLEG